MLYPALDPLFLPRSQERQKGLRRVATETAELGKENTLRALGQKTFFVSVILSIIGIKKAQPGVPIGAQQVRNPSSIHEGVSLVG